MAKNKERLIETEEKRLSEQLQNRKQEVEIPKEAMYWLERARKNDDPSNSNNQKTVTDPQNGQKVLKPAAPTNPKVVLPVSRKGLAKGLKKQVNSAARWLSVFVLRLIKSKKGEVVFPEEVENK